VAQRSAGAQSRAASNAPREYRAGNPEAVRAAKQRSAEITAQRAPAQVQQQQRTQQKASPSK